MPDFKNMHALWDNDFFQAMTSDDNIREKRINQSAQMKK
jgi:hypothetical protein